MKSFVVAAAVSLCMAFALENVRAEEPRNAPGNLPGASDGFLPPSVIAPPTAKTERSSSQAARPDADDDVGFPAKPPAAVPSKTPTTARLPAPAVTRAFALQHIEAIEIRRQINDLLRSHSPKISIGDSIIVTGDEKTLAIVTEFVRLLDVEKRVSQSNAPRPLPVPVNSPEVLKVTPRERLHMEFGDEEWESIKPAGSVNRTADIGHAAGESPWSSVLNDKSLDDELERLQKASEYLRKVHAFLEDRISTELKELPPSSNAPVNQAPRDAFDSLDDTAPPAEPAVPPELKRAVTDLFHTRQRLNRNELQAYATRLQKLKNSLADQERLADEIINRRVVELTKANAVAAQVPPSKTSPAAVAAVALEAIRKLIPQPEQALTPKPLSVIIPVSPLEDENPKGNAPKTVTVLPKLPQSASLPDAKPAVATPVQTAVPEKTKPLPMALAEQKRTLQGYWEANPLPTIGKLPLEQRTRVVFQGHRMASFTGTRRVASYHFATDTSRQPNRIWMNVCESDQPVSLRGIYEIKGEFLSMSVASVEAAFPTKHAIERPEFIFVSTEIPPELAKQMDQIPPPKNPSEILGAPAAAGSK